MDDFLLKFQKTKPHPCGYLTDQETTLRFIDLTEEIDQNEIDFLYRLGYRRSGLIMYTPICASCSACKPLRVINQKFQFGTSQKRCWKKNISLTVAAKKSQFDLEYYQLYERYIQDRHRDGEMFPATREQFDSFLCVERDSSIFVEYRDEFQVLMAVTLVDCIDNALAPIYTFFEPRATERGLGTYSILWLIQFAKYAELDYLYLGYWIRDCSKMLYKNKFKPFELFQDGLWKRSL